MRRYTIKRDNGEAITFEGEILGIGAQEAMAGNLAFDVVIYMTKGGSLVAQITRSWKDSRRQVIAAEVFNDASVLYGWLAKQTAKPTGHIGGASLDAWRAAIDARPDLFTVRVD